MISGINTTATSVLDANTKTTKTASSADEAQDRFLRLLVAQMNNQDPMNPMDNAQMTSQIAQINTVTGIQQLNETMQSMASQFSALQVLQGASMVGRSVLTDGNQLSTTDGVSRGSFELASAATDIRVDVLGPAGELLGSVNVGAQSAGRHSFEWDASQYSGDTSQLRFAVSASNGSNPVAATTLSQSRVVSASAENGALTLGLENGRSLAYTQVRAIM
jgi:flagellar basal-body rod modification protein FlgD